MKHIDIYYSSTCNLCTKAIEFFHSRGLTFTAYAVEWDNNTNAFVDSDNSRKMKERSGTTPNFVPQIFIGKRHIAGWRKLQPMIESGEFDRLLLS